MTLTVMVVRQPRPLNPWDEALDATLAYLTAEADFLADLDGGDTSTLALEVRWVIERAARRLLRPAQPALALASRARPVLIHGHTEPTG